jgi:hypothetical protein
MALTADNVLVGITGKVYVGPTGTAAPTTSGSTLNAAFKDLGYVSADGVTFTIDKSTNQIRAWQNADLVREVVTEASVQYSWKMLESNAESIKLYFGAAMVNGLIALVPGATGGRKSFVIDIVDGNKVIRHYIPSGEIVSVDEQTIANGEPVSYGVVMTAYATGGRTADIFHGEFESSGS